jgi:hypothetical protein
MSLSRKIADGVDELVKASGPPRPLSAEEGRHRIDLPVTLATAIGVECEGFDFGVATPGEMSLDDLRAWGGRVASRLTYLMEPLSLHEADAVAGEVVLRSQSPTPRNAKRSFFEARLRKTGTLRFDRIVYDETTRRRQPVPCQFTNEVLERLVDDLVATA